jgi:shikimate kinase
MKNVYLVGFMGCGKTKLAKKIAKNLKLDFIDTDFEIENKHSNSINNLFKYKGEEFFRKEETKLIKEIAKFNNRIIATGGGLPCHNKNLDLIEESGVMIYLRYSVNTLFNRLLKNSNKRPLIKNLNNNELRTYIEKTLKKREKTYRRSHKIIECDYLSEKEILREINSFIITF